MSLTHFLDYNLQHTRILNHCEALIIQVYNNYIKIRKEANFELQEIFMSWKRVLS